MEIRMNNVKEKLANARTLCPGMSEEVYALTDYMSETVNDTLVPHGMVLELTCVLVDVERGTCGFVGKKDLPKYLIENKARVLSRAPYVLQVIDAIADEKFAEEVRSLAKVVLNFNPPKRISVDVGEYPEYVKAAIDWWANAILAPEHDNGEEISVYFGMLFARAGKVYSEEEIKTFKIALAEKILESLEKYTTCTFDVDYGPCKALAEAGEKIGINPMMGWPWKTCMHVSKEQVLVSAGYAEPWKVIWSKNKK